MIRFCSMWTTEIQINPTRKKPREEEMSPITFKRSTLKNTTATVSDHTTTVKWNTHEQNAAAMHRHGVPWVSGVWNPFIENIFHLLRINITSTWTCVWWILLGHVSARLQRCVKLCVFTKIKNDFKIGTSKMNALNKCCHKNTWFEQRIQRREETSAICTISKYI